MVYTARVEQRTPMTRLLWLLTTAPIALFLALPALAGIPTSPPTPPDLSEEDETKLLAGKIVIHTDLDSEMVLGFIEIDAPPSRVWEEILDLEARLAENKPAKAMEVYYDATEGDWRQIKARWDIQVLGMDITWYTHYRYNASTSYFWFSLDPDEDSDIVKADGYYHVIPSDLIEGGSRFIYLADTDSGRRMPEAIREYLAKSGLKDMLKAIKKRAEQ